MDLTRRLVLACVNQRTTAPEIRRLAAEVRDWDAVILIARELALVAPLHLRLKGAGAAVPAAAAERVAALYGAQGLENARLLGRLGELLDALAAEGIAVIVLKGAALVEEVYADVAARPMADVDLLLRPSDLERAESVVRALGFAPEESYANAEWYRREMHHAVPYVSPDRGTVELHHQLIAPQLRVTIPTDELWHRARPATVAGRGTLVLATEDLALHIALNAAADRFGGSLRRLHDLAQVARHFAVDWNIVAERAAAWSAARPAYLALRLARDVTGMTVAPAILDRMRADAALVAPQEWLLRRLEIALLFRPREFERRLPTWIVGRAFTRLVEARGWRASGAVLVQESADIALRGLKSMA